MYSLVMQVCPLNEDEEGLKDARKRNWEEGKLRFFDKRKNAAESHKREFCSGTPRCAILQTVCIKCRVLLKANHMVLTLNLLSIYGVIPYYRAVTYLSWVAEIKLALVFCFVLYFH